MNWKPAVSRQRVFHLSLEDHCSILSVGGVKRAKRASNVNRFGGTVKIQALVDDASTKALDEGCS